MENTNSSIKSPQNVNIDFVEELLLLEAKRQLNIKIKKRKEANMIILKIMADYFNKYPDIRFGQALINLGILSQNENGDIVDPFNRESVDMLNNLNLNYEH